MSRNPYLRVVPLLSAGAALGAIGCKLVPAPNRAPAEQVAASGSGFKPDGNMPRDRVPDELKWDLTPLVVDDAAFEEDLAAATAEIKILAAFRGQLGDPAALEECLDLYFSTRLSINKLTLYASMRFDSYAKDTRLQANKDKAQAALAAFMSGATFIREEVLATSDQAMAAAYTKEPGLAAYRPYLDELRRRRARVLSPEAERVLSLAGDNLWAEIDLNEIPSHFERIFKGIQTDLLLPTIVDEKGASVQLNFSNYGKYRASSDRRVRRDAVEGVFAALRANQHALAATFAGQIDFNVFLARVRGYDSALAAYLDKDNINPAVYRNLIKTIRANLHPLHEYVRLRKQVAGLAEVRIYDLYTPLVESVAMEVPFAEAREILPRALAPLGPEYLAVLNHGLDPKNGWLDLYPHADKDSGAFSSSVFGFHPYVKMNYYDGVDDLSTLAHEYGHALHSHFAMNSQPYITFNYVPFVAEIASTINEKLLSDDLLERAGTNAEKLSILNELLETIRTTIYRQTLFAEFELEAHTAAEKGTPLTAEVLNGLYRRLIADYYGPDFSLGPNDEMEWAYIPHFYYKYYMYAYATGLSSGIALAERIKKGGAPAREAYLGMLRGGSSRPPLDLLKGAGVDLTEPAAVESAARLMGDIVRRMRLLIQQ